MRAAELQGSCDTRAQFKEEAQRADPETEARWWLGLAGPSEPFPAVPDMAAGRDRGDLAARQLVFLLPGKRGRRVGRKHSGWRRREAFVRVSTGPRSPGERGPSFGAPHFAYILVTCHDRREHSESVRVHRCVVAGVAHPACGGQRCFHAVVPSVMLNWGSCVG